MSSSDDVKSTPQDAGDDQATETDRAAETAPAVSKAREAMKAKKEREVQAAISTDPGSTLTITVSIISYIVGVIVGWAIGSWVDGDPWPIAVAGVLGGVVGFLLGRALLRGFYAIRH